MDTNSNIPAQKNITSVEILHLDELGYGPQGQHTRREWRAECLENLLAGKARFESWQNNFLEFIDIQLSKKNFDCQYVSNDKKSESYLYLGTLEPQFPWTLDFILQEFNEPLECKNFIFKIITMFAGSIYKYDVNFKNSIFREGAYFCGGKFQGEFTSMGSVYDKAADFSGSLFNQFVDFRESKFSSNAFFNGTKYFGWARFGSCSFSKEVRFRNTNFEHGGDFRCVKFGYLTDFGWSVFNGAIDCNSCFFNGLLDFAYSQIDEIADFGHCSFIRYIDFSSTKFGKDAIFKNSIFKGEVRFKNSIFSGDAIFHSVIFNGNADFLKSSFAKQLRFDNQQSEHKKWDDETEFLGEANFENATFENVGHFDRVRFKGQIPNFLGVDNAKTVLVFSRDEYFNNEDVTETAVKRLGQLKRLADEHGQTDHALMFNAFELRAKAKQSSAGSLIKITTNLYEYLSDYGRSFGKPMLWYGVLICLSALFAMIYSTYSDSPTEEQQVLCKPIKDQPPPLKLTYGRAVVEYAMFRAGGLMDFTDTGKQNNAVNCRLFEEPIEPPLMRAWGIFKGIASIALLFLAALGLRNKYRIK